VTGADLISGASVAGGADYVRLVELSKRFGAFLAVDRVSLRIARGEIFCLLGASGSGKTTLLRMLAGFETPSSGQLLLDGQDLTQVPPYRRPLNMMFQSYALFPHMDVERNVAFGLESLHGVAHRVVIQRVVLVAGNGEALAQRGHARILHARAENFSFGDMDARLRRLVLGLRAVIRRPLAQFGELCTQRLEPFMRRIVAVEHRAGIAAIGELRQNRCRIRRYQLILDVGAHAAEMNAPDLSLTCKG